MVVMNLMLWRCFFTHLKWLSARMVAPVRDFLVPPILVHLEEVSIENLGGIPSPEGADNSFSILENHESLCRRIALE